MENIRTILSLDGAAEDVSRREANVKHFCLDGNRRQAISYSANVHFRDAHGRWAAMMPRVRMIRARRALPPHVWGCLWNACPSVLLTFRMRAGRAHIPGSTVHARVGSRRRTLLHRLHRTVFRLPLTCPRGILNV